MPQDLRLALRLVADGKGFQGDPSRRAGAGSAMFPAQAGMNWSMRTAMRRSPGMALYSPPMDLIHGLIGVWDALVETPSAWPVLAVGVYILYACLRTA